MRDHSHHVEVSRDEAAQALLDHAHFEPKTEILSVFEAGNRVLAKDVYSKVEVPNARSCRMDSVAVHWKDFKDGMPDTRGWKKGIDWEFANTGVAMPEGFDTAIVIEHVTLSDDLSEISFAAPPSAQYVGTSEAGSKLNLDSVLAQKHQRLTPLLLSAILSGNVREIEVLKKPRIAFIPTGNELVHAQDSIPLGKNIETNSLLISEKIRNWGGEPVVWDIVKDDHDEIKQAVKDACEQCDIVVLNAGSSKGSDDWNVEMLEEIGTILYHQVCHGPGHHSFGAVVDGKVIVGISGPPGGAAFTTDFYLYPLMMKYFNQDIFMKKLQVRLVEDFPAGGPGKPSKPKKLYGEDRPSVVEPGGRFWSVKQLRLALADDGVLEAYPADGVHLAPLVANEMHAYYMADVMKDLPKAGDMIEVDLRP
ncbi:MAG: molybdopterin-binding protein [Coriobacteriia bacterium]|nr:molybdopterin-binding protein [Coriobacteriia bacterium]